MSSAPASVNWLQPAGPVPGPAVPGPRFPTPGNDNKPWKGPPANDNFPGRKPGARLPIGRFLSGALSLALLPLTIEQLLEWWEFYSASPAGWTLPPGWTKCGTPSCVGHRSDYYVLTQSFQSCTTYGACPTGQILNNINGCRSNLYSSYCVPAPEFGFIHYDNLIVAECTSGTIGTASARYTVHAQFVRPVSDVTNKPTYGTGFALPVPSELPAPLPWVYPAIHPMSLPINTPVPTPRPVPVRWLPRREPGGDPWTSPVERPGVRTSPEIAPVERPWIREVPEVPGVRVTPVVNPVPVTEPGVPRVPSIDFVVSPRPYAPYITPVPVGRPGYHYLRPPGRKEWERKPRWRAGLGALGTVLNIITEGADLASAVWDALPDGFKTPGALFRDKLADILDYFGSGAPFQPTQESADFWNEAIDNAIENQIEDYFLGKLGRASAEATQNNPYWVRPVGPTTGPAI